MSGESDPIWKALADSSRRSILDRLRDGPRTTRDLCRSFRTSRFAVMKHLDVLAGAGLLVVERRGRDRWNHLDPAPLRSIERWLGPYEGIRPAYETPARGTGDWNPGVD
jgi:DNA-binding transcriptional ArsR family regulator